jgi:uncharacterized RDD family membrane protein YckC
MAEPSPPPRRRPRSLTARLLGTGARGARRVADATGIDEAVELATEETIVQAVESPAFERALERVLAGPVVEEAMERALDSPAVERAVTRAIDSEMIDRVWERLLASDEAQKLVERVAEAPEVRAAIAAQGVGLVSDVGRQISRAAARLDDTLESLVRRVLGRPRRTEPTRDAGLVSRFLAAVVDAALLNGAFVLAAALVALIARTVFGASDEASTPALVTGAGAWVGFGSLYLLAFWSLAGQTPGMRFLGLRLDADGEHRLGLRRAARRLVGLVLAVLPFGAGLVPILFSERRRGVQDRIAETGVVRAGLDDRTPRGPGGNRPAVGLQP